MPDPTPTPLPPTIAKMSEADRLTLQDMVEEKSWVLASNVQPFTDRELEIIAQSERDKGPVFSAAVKQRFYDKHHWDSLRTFLFGGYVDIPGLVNDPGHAWDPATNPWVKVLVPGWAFTMDEHDHETPFKRFPDRDYLRFLAYTWVHQRKLLVPKSRQVLVTWLFCAIGAHELVARQATRSGFVTKKEGDADGLCNRVKVVLEKLPYSRFDVPRFNKTYCNVRVEENHSTIMGMGENDDAVRSYTFSWVFFDEMAFHENTAEVVRAVVPSLKMDRFTGVSSSDGKEEFYDMISDGDIIPVLKGD